jgi:hypothetical protein
MDISPVQVVNVGETALVRNRQSTVLSAMTTINFRIVLQIADFASHFVTANQLLTNANAGACPTVTNNGAAV